MRSVFLTTLRVLFFRAKRDELVALDNRHLVFGLLCTWVVGMGRYWDNPKATFVQHLGIGSVVYVFVLAAFLWLIVKPLRPANWSYRNLLTYITLTSPPAVLYAIPVEHWYDMSTAREINAWFLGIVAVWRVALLFVYLGRAGEMRIGARVVATLSPLCVIVNALAALNLEHAVFSIMSTGEVEPTVNDDAFLGLLILSYISAYVAFPLLVSYVFLIVVARRTRGIEPPDPSALPPPASDS